MFCSNCGARLKDNAKFCGECGKSVTEVQPLLRSVSVVMFCSNCSAQLRINALFCDRCGYSAKDDIRYLKGIGDPERITGLWLHYSAYRDNYNFSLREKDGDVLYSCNYWLLGVGGIVHEDLPVDPAYMQALRELVHEHDFVYLIDDDPSKRTNPDCDEPSCHLQFEWDDHDPLKIRFTYLPPNGDKIKIFLMDIAENTQ